MDTEELYRIWRTLKSFFEFSGRLSPTTLHIVLGVGAFLAIYIVFGRSKRAAIIAWLFIFATQFANECVDIYFSVVRDGDINVRGTLKDFIATLFLPSLAVMIIWRDFARRLLKDLYLGFKNKPK
jgi:hypothetical protein